MSLFFNFKLNKSCQVTFLSLAILLAQWVEAEHIHFEDDHSEHSESCSICIQLSLINSLPPATESSPEIRLLNDYYAVFEAEQPLRYGTYVRYSPRAPPISQS